MDIKQLKTLVILCETLNYQRAASILQYEPSTLHKHIQKLEEETGVQLFIKQGKKLAATERCMEVERYARNILNEYHTMISGEPAESNGMEPITVTGCETNLTKAFEGMLKDYLHLHPGLDMSVPVVRNKDVPDMVRSWTVPGSKDTKIRAYCRITWHYAALLRISIGVRPSFKLMRS